MNKLIVVIMGQNCEKFIKMCLESVKSADAIVYCDGGSTDGTLKYCYAQDNVTWIENKYDQEDKQMNGKQRNFYLEYLKKNYPDDWAICLDADEVVEDINKVKEFIQTAEPGLYSPVMRHFIGDLGHEDATQKKHGVLNRLFKISEAKVYPHESHPVLIGKMKGLTNCCTIWHLGHLPVEYMKYIQKRYKEHEFNSVVHTKKFLKQWRDAHLFGVYPKRQVNPIEIPKIILDNFGIDFDELYFRNRREMTVQHYQDAIDWKKFFNLGEVYLYGCGFGQRVKALESIGINAAGFELSDYAVNNSLCSKISKSDITKQDKYEPRPEQADLTVAYDLLEHIDYDSLTTAITNLIYRSKKHILISVPFKGTPPATADPTHIIIEDREFWIKKFTDKGLKEVEVPQHFLFREQLLIFEK